MDSQNIIDNNFFSDDEWHKSEMSGSKIGDARLDKRLIKITKDLSSNISSSINQASGDWHSTKAAYNFFENEKVTPDKILAPHFKNTAARMSNHDVVLAIQDTSTINYASHNAVELGHIGKEGTSGLMQHNTLVATTNGLPLGLIDQNCWSRPLTPEEKASQKRLTIEERESYKWIKSLRNTQQRAPELTKVVTVCDRESDIYEFFDEAEVLGASFLVRLKNDREIEESMSRVKDYLQSQEISAEYEITVPKKKGEYSERTATVVLRYASVTISAPESIVNDVINSQIGMNAIYVEEINAPAGVKPVKWYLVTNLEVSSVSEAMKMVAWYKLRWLVEIFHKTEKSCCSIEDCRLETAERLMNFLSLKSIIAWRVMFVTYINRQEPKASAEVILSQTEIIVLKEVIHNRNSKIKKIKTVRHAVHAIASLGGHMNRIGDGEPGIITVCRGMQRLHDFTEGFILNKQTLK